MYDWFSADYDIMVDWHSRLAREWPFLETVLRPAYESATGGPRLLDVGCATGHHARYFAEHGWEVVGADPSVSMLERATENATGQHSVSFVQAGFGELRAATVGAFDAVTCLGNTLPHARDRAALHRALVDVATVLRPGGVFLVQQLNYDRILASRQRFLGVSSGHSAGEELVFLRFYDYLDPLLRFNVVTLRRQPESDWQMQAQSTLLGPAKRALLGELLAVAGFAPVEYYGGVDGSALNPATSNDLVFVAHLE